MNGPELHLGRSLAAFLAESVLTWPRRHMIIQLQWLVVSITSYLLLFSDQLLVSQNTVHAFVLFCLFSAASLYFAPAKFFESHILIAGVVVVDTLALTSALIVTNQLETDFYLTYFLIIIIAGFWQDFRWSLSFAILFSLLYSASVLFAETITTHLLLRVPFIFIASIVYSYFVQLIRHEHNLRERAESEARRDFLTGLPNRHSYEERIALEMERAQRYHRPISLLMLDIDNFKLVNDKFGHDAGDRVLRKIATEVRQCLRASDFVARLGGEEFAVILPETDLDEAVDVAKRILATVRNNPVELVQGQLSVTISIGLSSGHGSDSREMLLRADHALYGAKRSGKDRVEVYTGGRTLEAAGPGFPAELTTPTSDSSTSDDAEASDPTAPHRLH